MYCPNCHKSYDVDYWRCPECGAPLAEKQTRDSSGKQGFGIASMVLGMLALMSVWLIAPGRAFCRTVHYFRNYPVGAFQKAWDGDRRAHSERACDHCHLCLYSADRHVGGYHDRQPAGMTMKILSGMKGRKSNIIWRIREIYKTDKKVLGMR